MMRRHFSSSLLVIWTAVALIGCGSGGGGGSGGSDQALFTGPLMYINTQLRIYDDRNLQLGDFNNDGFPELVYEGLSGRPYDEHLFLAPGSETQMFEDVRILANGIRTTIADFDGDGNLDMFAFLVFEDRRGTLPPYDWCFLHGNGDNTFADPVPLGLVETVGAEVELSKADINGDGFEDLLSLGYAEAGVLPIVNQGDGTFELAPLVESTENFGFVEGAALNNDSFDDIIFFGEDDVYTALSNGDGTFSELQPVLTTDADLFPSTIADVNGDTLDDLVGTAADGIVVFLSDGDGTFTSVVSEGLPLPFTGQPIHAVADFDGDQNPDVVFSTEQIVRGETLEQLYFALGNGDGTFGPAALLLDEALFDTAVTTDADRDGNLDLLISVSQGQAPLYLRAYFGNGDGTFRVEEPDRLAIGGSGYLVRARTLTGYSFSDGGISPDELFDVDGDGNVDIMATHGATDEVGLMLGRGNGTFEPEHRIAIGDMGIDITADLDVDGDLDFFGRSSISSYISILRNYGNTDLRVLPAIPFSSVEIIQVGVEDIDGDDLPDIALWTEDGGVGVAYNLGNMQFTPLMSVGNVGDRRGNRISDVNGDGRLDFVSFGPSTEESADDFIVFPGAPGRTFGDPVLTPFSSDRYDLAIVDQLDADGRADAVVSKQSSSDVVIFKGQADGTFQLDQEFFVDGLALPPRSADLDADGDRDVYLWMITDEALSSPRFGTAQWHIFLNNGPSLSYAGLASTAFMLWSSGNFGISMADINGDELPDPIGVDITQVLSITPSNGDGTFQHTNYFQTETDGDFLVGDIDHDGDGDIIAKTADDGELIVLENRMFNN